jgi:small-conductance mechanosensitive channel
MAGLAGLVILKKELQIAFPGISSWYQFVFYGLILIVAVMLLLYFNVSGVVNLFNRWIKNQKYFYLVEALQSFSSDHLIKLLLISFLRYCVFVLQYILLFLFFGVDVGSISSFAG